MTGFYIDRFGGIAPAISPRKLADHLAVRAEDVDLRDLALRPRKDHADEGVVLSATTETMYPYPAAGGNGWLEWDHDVDVVKVPVVDDVLERIIYTDEDYPKIRSGTSVYRLGIPRPDAPPTFVVSDAPTPGDPNDLALAEDITYIITYVDTWGYEGPPSAAAIVASRIRDTDATLTFVDTVPSGAYNFGTGALKRIYRSNTGTQATAFQFVGEVAIGDVSFVDDVPNEELQEVISSTYHIGPPDDDSGLYPNGPMQGIINLPGGAFAGFSGSTLCFSEPYIPHAWPLAYRLAMPNDIVGIKPIPQGVVVLTTGRPVLVMGSHPSTMAQIEIESDQPCVNKRTIVDMGDAVLYLSPDGICAVVGNGVQLLSETIVAPEAFKGLITTGLAAVARATKYEDYYLLYLPGYTTLLFTKDAAQKGATSASPTALTLDAPYYDIETDNVYFREGTALKTLWNHATDYTGFVWESKEFVADQPRNFTVFRADTSVYGLFINRVYIYADGVEVVTNATLTAENDYMVRIPSGFKARVWKFKLTGQMPVHSAGLWDNMKEVQ